VSEKLSIGHHHHHHGSLPGEGAYKPLPSLRNISIFIFTILLLLFSKNCDSQDMCPLAAPKHTTQFAMRSRHLLRSTFHHGLLLHKNKVNLMMIVALPPPPLILYNQNRKPKRRWCEGLRAPLQKVPADTMWRAVTSPQQEKQLIEDPETNDYRLHVWEDGIVWKDRK
jgi:hypothetical protein